MQHESRSLFGKAVHLCSPTCRLESSLQICAPKVTASARSTDFGDSWPKVGNRGYRPMLCIFATSGRIWYKSFGLDMTFSTEAYMQSVRLDPVFNDRPYCLRERRRQAITTRGVVITASDPCDLAPVLDRRTRSHRITVLLAPKLHRDAPA